LIEALLSPEAVAEQERLLAELVSPEALAEQERLIEALLSPEQLEAEVRRLVIEGAGVAADGVAAGAEYLSAVQAAERVLGPAENWSRPVECADVIGSGVELRRVESRAGASEEQRLALALLAGDLQQLEERWLHIIGQRSHLQQLLRSAQAELAAERLRLEAAAAGSQLAAVPGERAGCIPQFSSREHTIPATTTTS